MRHALALALLATIACGPQTSPRAEPAPPTPVASIEPVAPAKPPSSAPACPDEMAHVERFCIDRWEAHLADATDPERPRDPYTRPAAGQPVVARSRAGVAPQAYLNRFEAAAACRAAGKRLCAATEWYRACAGPKARRFPYGDTEIAGHCNVGKAHVMQKVFGSVRYTFDAHYNSPKLNQEPGFLAPTGAYAACVSAEGALDLVGNLHEWVSDDVSAALTRRVPLELSADKLGPAGNGVFMGGYYSSHGEHGTGCAYATTNHKPDYHDYSIGFRCCEDAR